MQYHAHALAAHDVDVDLVGLAGTPLPAAVTDEPLIAIHRLQPSMLRTRRAAYARDSQMPNLWRCESATN